MLPDVGPGARAGAGALFGGHVLGRSCDGPRCTLRGGSREPEVHDHGACRVRDEHVRGLEIQVRDSRRVRRAERAGDLEGELYRDTPGHGSAREALREGLPAQELRG